MPVEIKQLVVRGEIRNEAEPNPHDAVATFDPEQLKEEILEACRKMMEELLEQQRER